MASGGQPQTPDNRTFLFRLQILLIDGGLPVLRDILDTCLTSQRITFSACLNQEKQTISHLKSRGVITQVQYDVLFPVGSQVPTTSDLDITLIICLLRNLKCFGLNKKFDWRATPAPTDWTIEADIWRLKDFRNNISHISTTTAIQQKDFTLWWNDIENILVRRSSSPVNIQQTIAKFKNCPLDPDEERRIQKEINKWKDYEADVDQLKQEMTNIKENDTAMKRDLKQIKKTVTEVKKDLDNVQENDTALHKALEDIKEKNAVLKRNLEDIKESVTDVTKDVANLKENNDAVKIDLEDINNNVTALKRDLDVLKETYTAVKGDLENIKENVSEVKKDLEDVKVNDTAVKKDLEDVKENVTALKNDHDDIKENVNEVKKDIEDIKENVTEVNKNLECIKKNVTEVENDLKEVKENDTAVKRDIDDIKENVTKVKKDLHVVTENVTEVKKDLDEIKIQQWKEKSNETDSSVPTEERKYQNNKKELQGDLIKFYRKRCSSIPLSPLLEEKETPLAGFYVMPDIVAVKQKSETCHEEKRTPINSLGDLFSTGSEDQVEIYLLADAGFGKTAFSKYLTITWCQAHRQDKKYDVNMCFKDNELKALSKFEFLFLVFLRDHTSVPHIDDMIRNQFSLHLPSLKSLDENSCRAKLNEIFYREKCLIILDGLDEWTHSGNSCSGETAEIPYRCVRDNCVILTTTRPWKLGVSKIKSSQMDKKVQLVQLSEDSTRQLKENAVRKITGIHDYIELESEIWCLNEEIRELGLEDMQVIPLLLMYIVCLWCNNIPIGNSKHEIYTNIIEFLLSRTSKKHPEVQPSSESSASEVPEYFKSHKYCKIFYSLITSLAELAYQTLFNENRENTLVFDRTVAEKYLKADDMKFTLHSGMLSESRSTTLIKEIIKVSFSHKTIQEYFAAIFISSQSDAQKIVVEKCRNIQNILDMSKMCEFISKMNPHLMCAISNDLMSVINEDEKTRVYRTREGHEYMYNYTFYDIQGMFLSCLQEMPESENIQLCLQDFCIGITTEDSWQLQRLLIQNKTNIKSLYIDTMETFSSLQEIIDEFSLTDLSHIQSLHYRGDSEMTEAVINQILFPSLQSVTLICGKLSKYEENLNENMARCQNLQYLDIKGFTLSHKILESFFNFISGQKSMKELTLVGIDCIEHGCRDCKRWNLDLSQHSTLSKLYLHELPGRLQLNISTPSLVNVKLSSIIRGESSLLLSRDMLNIEHVELRKMEMSAGNLQNYITVLENLPQSVTVWMNDIKPKTEYKRARKNIRRSQTFHVIRDDSYGFEFKTIKPSKEYTGKTFLNNNKENTLWFK